MSDETGGGSSRLTLISNRAGQIQVRYNNIYSNISCQTKSINAIYLSMIIKNLESDGYQEE